MSNLKCDFGIGARRIAWQYLTPILLPLENLVWPNQTVEIKVLILKFQVDGLDPVLLNVSSENWDWKRKRKSYYGSMRLITMIYNKNAR